MLRTNSFHLRPLDSTHDSSTEHFEIIWVRKGSGLLSVDLHRYTLSENQVYFLSPGQLRRLQPDDDLQGYHISLGGEFYFSAVGRLDYTCLSHRFTPGKNITIFRPGPDGQKIISDIITLAAAEYELNTTAHPDILGSFVRLLLLYLSREPSTTCDHHDDKEAEERVKEFILLVQRNFLKKKMVAEYASDMAISSGHLNHIVKKISGFSPSYHIQQCIILEAKRRMFSEKMRMKEVAAHLGFEDAAHFSRYFKNKTGVNFTSYKNNFI